MTTAQSTTEVVIHVPTMLYVWYAPDNGAVARIMVYLSTLIRPTDTLYSPVAALLSEVGARLVHEETFNDPSMMHGVAHLLTYRAVAPDITPEPATGPAIVQELRAA